MIKFIIGFFKLLFIFGIVGVMSCIIDGIYLFLKEEN